MSRSIEIVEVGPRDGLQNDPVLLDTPVKLEFIERLIGAGMGKGPALALLLAGCGDAGGAGLGEQGDRCRPGPGATGSGSVTAMTVRSSSLSSSGWMKRMSSVRSTPVAVCRRVTSMRPRPCARNPRCPAVPVSRRKVDPSRKAFR